MTSQKFCLHDQTAQYKMVILFDMTSVIVRYMAIGGGGNGAREI